ncbi:MULTISPECIES: choline ABC transporter substrate-binding protein [Brucella]|uniref:Choline ABC transporter, periplasmic binding protein n=2 Tax=Brucella melitensis TaxID=29459 RepID=C0REL1_BRUMB|nr:MULTISPECIES: choline ABC transporter substrate-binding protein [Brucella]EXU82464.1 glycine/betaine ABC transporter substrate-binding protein [Brucella melitensis 548]ACO01333.1 choline ABC transporter, periplasmic binding protein [Brucella melitensis ATCC 23457]ADZ66661.1 choline ABC transporter periplasmic binding protein [Brucella melitensis M28]ADZ87515.1 choline ABC transporter, periplasmic binding protein [Brucella melitensis M5-90]AIJ96715.1 choline ABC transporter, periplasmic bind
MKHVSTCMFTLALGGFAMGTAMLSTPEIGLAAEPASCSTVRFSDVGWTDITSTTAVATEILKGLGYTTDIKVLSVPVTYASVAKKDIDVFLGYWNPSMSADLQPYLDNKTVETLRTNLTGAKYTLAVPQFVFDEGLKDFKDIAKFKDKLGGKIYGIEPGNDGNRLILSMINKNAFGLKSFELAESSEQGMLAQVARSIKSKDPIVFLAWEPHPMNKRFKIAYLTGGDDFFGPNLGGAKVETNVRTGYTQECPNVGKFLTNLEFNLDMENDIMGKILDDGEEPAKAATEWLKANPGVLNQWLAGVTTVDGKEGLPAVRSALGL